MVLYINKERLSNNPKNQPPWLGGIKLSRSFINSIPNEKDLDKLVLLSSIIWFFLYFFY